MYHTNLTKDQIRNSKIALIPGDPFRVPKICEEILNQYGGQCLEIAWKREYRTFLCDIGKHTILVTSSGIGGPSTSIALEELAMLGVQTFIRVGTTAAIQEHISIGDVIITTGSVRLDGASKHYAPIEYPAVAHYEVVNSLIKGATKSNAKYHAGITASSDTFYPGQERYESFTNYVIKDLQGRMLEWQKLKVLNYEMESATLLTLCNVMGLKGGCISGVIGNRSYSEDILDESLALGENKAIEVAASSLEYFF